MIKRLDYPYYKSTITMGSEDAPGGVVVYYADGDEEIIHVNQYVIDLFECDSVDDFMQLTGGTFRGLVYREDIDSAEDSIWGQIEHQDNPTHLDHIYYRIKTKSGRLLNIEDFGRLVEYEDDRPVFYVFIVEMKVIGYVDWLTGLPAMKRFQHLAQMGAGSIRSRGERPVAVALDLIGLKEFNSQYSREEGDRLLCEFSDVLRRHFGSEACSRFGEDHFYAFAPESGIEERIWRLFADFKGANEGRVLPVRVGLYVCHSDENIAEVGFDRAKFACDLDRTTWHSHITWFNEDMRAEAKQRIHILEHLDEALNYGWVQPYYQGIVRAATGRVCSEEALARWIDPVYGHMSPSVFIPVLEESELLPKLDLHMIECVLRDFKVKQDAGLPIVPVSVNISLRDLGQIDIADEILRMAGEYGVPHDLLRVEFTESAASADPEFFKEQVDVLRSNGFDVWLDDFGSGYSSLNMLQEYDFDLIKLDLEFVSHVDSRKAREILIGVIRSAGKLGVGTLAEGVETEEQAVFLEAIGCNLLQGFYYSKPQPLSAIIDEWNDGSATEREVLSERSYWNAVNAIDIIEPTANVEGRAVDGTRLSEFPAGVMEKRGDSWSLLRSNLAYRQFLDRGGAIALEESNLEIVPFKKGVDREYSEAAERSLSSGMWERVAGRMEHGTGLQFYTKIAARTPEADAFVLAAVPTMLGTALGTYGDVPVAYAVLRAVLDDSGERMVDAEYVYANTVYCDWCKYEYESIPGRSFLGLTGEEAWDWFPYFYQATVNGKHVHDVIYSPELDHWLSFNVAPSKVDTCFVYAFTIADDEHRERQEMRMGLDTSALIIDVSNAFNSDASFDDSMKSALEMISQAVHPERLYVFERGEKTTRSAYEWCAEGIEPRISQLQNLSNEDFKTWESLLKRDATVIIPDIEELAEVDLDLYERFSSRGIKRILATPLYHDSDLIGFLVADNYNLEDGIDTRKLLEAVAPILSVKLANNKLLQELEYLGTHDSLTGLLNRRGVDIAIHNRRSKNPDEPFIVILMDVDDFKTMNDKYGHAVGDEALVNIARGIDAITSDTCITGRNGGDEFIVLLFGEDRLLMDDFLSAFTGHDLTCSLNGEEYPISVSIGYVSYPDQVSTLKSAYTKADVALYAVKLSGKSHAKRYSPEFETKYRSMLGFSSRDLSENIPGGIVVHKAHGDQEIMFANDEFIEMLECEDPEDLMEYTGGNFRGFTHPDDWDRVKEALASQAESGGAGAKGFANYRICTKSGNVKNIAANSRLVETHEVGKVFYVILVDRDERRQ